MKRVLLIGASGQLGTCLQEEILEGFEFCEKEHNRVNLLNEGKIIELIMNTMPDIVINCAACNGVDSIENAMHYAFKVNGMAPIEISDFCIQKDIFFVHISSDFVFNSANGETIFPDDSYGIMPPNVYGFSKLISDWGLSHQISRGRENILLVRTAWLFSEYKNNFLTKMIEKFESDDKIKGADDVKGSPTYARDLASVIWGMLDRGLHGCWNAANCSDSPSFNKVSKYDMINEIRNVMGFEQPISIARVHDLDLNANRATCTALYCDKLANNGLGMRHWKEALKDACSRFNKNRERTKG